MNIRSARCHGFSRERNLGVCLAMILIFLRITSPEALADNFRDLAACAQIEHDAARLNCYDRLSGRKPGDSAPAEKSGETISPGRSPEVSYFSQLWELDRESRRGKYAIVPHRSNFVLPFTYNDSPNVAAVREADPGKELKRPEVKFQLSLKTKLWQDILGKDLDLWFGYTQQSFWQLYSFDDSSPFRETNYEPEIILNYRTDYRLLGWKGRFLNVGLNHQSNGQSEPLSRSWNRVVASAGFEKGNFALLLKGWYRIPESSEDDDNPKIGKIPRLRGDLGLLFLERESVRDHASQQRRFSQQSRRPAGGMEFSPPRTDQRLRSILQRFWREPSGLQLPDKPDRYRFYLEGLELSNPPFKKKEFPSLRKRR